MDNQQGPTVYHWEFCSTCGRLNAREPGGEQTQVYVWLSHFAVYLNYHNIVN